MSVGPSTSHELSMPCNTVAGVTEEGGPSLPRQEPSQGWQGLGGQSGCSRTGKSDGAEQWWRRMTNLDILCLRGTRLHQSEDVPTRSKPSVEALPLTLQHAHRGPLRAVLLSAPHLSDMSYILT